ncbi:MAG: creatininase family protein [Pirellulaceae bacterium]
MNASWNLAESNYGDIKHAEFEVAVLPFGATEPHNLHLPYSTDTLEATIIGQHVCRAAHERGASVVLLPTLPYGTESNLREFPLAMNLNPSTMTMIISDLVETLVHNGIYKIMLLNSHGGNSFKPVLRELSGETEAHLFLCDWYQSISDVYDEIFEHREDHAGEMETSFALAYFPELVARNEDGSLRADQGEKRSARLAALNKGWVSITRPWHLLTENSGAANPHAATPDKGQRLMKVVVERLAGFICELSAAQIDDTFPY